MITKIYNYISSFLGKLSESKNQKKKQKEYGKKEQKKELEPQKTKDLDPLLLTFF